MDGYTASQRGLLLMSPATDSAASEMNRMHGEAAEASAELERLRLNVRALANKYYAVDASQPGAVVSADTVESELRALLND